MSGGIRIPINPRNVLMLIDCNFNLIGCIAGAMYRLHEAAGGYKSPGKFPGRRPLRGREWGGIDIEESKTIKKML